MKDFFKFPYKKLRNGQVEIAQMVYDTLKKKEMLIIEAPNGSGKTAGILSGALKAIEDYNYRIIFLTRTKKQVEHVYNEARKFRKLHPKILISPTISYRDGCNLYRYKNRRDLIDEMLPIFCRISVKTFSCPFYSNSFYKKVPDVPLSKFIQLSKERMFCPIEVLRKKNHSSNLIITTFTSFFDLKNRYYFLWNGENVGIIIDEAHNFPKFLLERNIKIREYEIEKLYLLFSKLKMKDFVLFITSLRHWCLNHKKGIEMKIEPFISTSHLKDNLFRLIDLFYYSFNDFYNFLTLEDSILVIKLLSFINFVKEHINSESSFIRVWNENDEFVIELLEFDPELVFKKRLKELGDTPLIFSSATFFSISSFMEELGIFESKVIEIKTDPLERKCITIIDPTVSTEIRKRNEQLYTILANKIIKIYEAHLTPLPVFFTSYYMLRNVLRKINPSYMQKIIVEDEKENVEEGIQKINKIIEESKILFAVLGGKYSEGIDFPQEKISIIVIIGLPFPPPSYKLKRSMEIKKKKRGWKYAFFTEMLIPTISKMVQASGRIFRTYKKKGIVYLLDERYLRKDIYSMLPFWLKENLVISSVEKLSLRSSRISSSL